MMRFGFFPLLFLYLGLGGYLVQSNHKVHQEWLTYEEKLDRLNLENRLLTLGGEINRQWGERLLILQKWGEFLDQMRPGVSLESLSKPFSQFLNSGLLFEVLVFKGGGNPQRKWGTSKIGVELGDLLSLVQAYNPNSFEVLRENSQLSSHSSPVQKILCPLNNPGELLVLIWNPLGSIKKMSENLQVPKKMNFKLFPLPESPQPVRDRFKIGIDPKTGLSSLQGILLGLKTGENYSYLISWPGEKEKVPGLNPLGEIYSFSHPILLAIWSGFFLLLFFQAGKKEGLSKKFPTLLTDRELYQSLVLAPAMEPFTHKPSAKYPSPGTLQPWALETLFPQELKRFLSEAVTWFFLNLKPHRSTLHFKILREFQKDSSWPVFRFEIEGRGPFGRGGEFLKKIPSSLFAGKSLFKVEWKFTKKNPGEVSFILDFWGKSVDSFKK